MCLFAYSSEMLTHYHGFSVQGLVNAVIVEVDRLKKHFSVNATQELTPLASTATRALRGL